MPTSLLPKVSGHSQDRVIRDGLTEPPGPSEDPAMIVAIHQPNLLPRLKVLQKLALADKWIVLDTVSFARREYQSRALLVPNHGSHNPFWLTAPVHCPNGRNTLISDTFIAEPDWIARLQLTILCAFRASTPYRPIRDELLDRVSQCSSDVTSLGIGTTLSLLLPSGNVPQITRASDLESDRSHVEPFKSPTDRIVWLCQQVGATTYISDSGGTQYLDEAPFLKADISVLWAIWRRSSSIVARDLSETYRNGSALNILARSVEEYNETVRACLVSRDRHAAERNFEHSCPGIPMDRIQFVSEQPIGSQSEGKST